jgi:membrane protein YqaA with SNARE-associated domain
VTLGILGRLSQFLLVMGIPGLLIISFLDSAAVPLAGGPDAVVLLLSWQRPALAFIIAIACTLGSTLGCLVLYSVGEKSGEKALSRFNAGKTNWVKRKMESHGVWAIIAGVVAPPPFPTKVLVLAAGVLKIGKARFAGAVLAGRILRYSLVAYLGAHFGGQASAVMKDYFPLVALLLICVFLLIYLIRALHNSTKPAGGTIFPTQGK